MYSEVNYCASTQMLLNFSYMKIESYNRFKLLKKDLPEIIKKVVTIDANVGGIKLLYEVAIVNCLVFMFLGKQRLINLTLLPKQKMRRVFLNPYKEVWSEKRDSRLPKCLWGKNDYPLTALWVELESDYENLKSGMVLLKKEIRDTNITKHLSRTHEMFYIKSKYNQFV
jgi:hypothetical protein